MYLLDVNVLLGYAYKEHKSHSQVASWINYIERTQPQSRFATCSIVELGRGSRWLRVRKSNACSRTSPDETAVERQFANAPPVPRVDLLSVPANSIGGLPVAATM